MSSARKRLVLVMTEDALRHNGGQDESLRLAHAHKHSLASEQTPTLSRKRSVRHATERTDSHLLGTSSPGAWGTKQPESGGMHHRTHVRICAATWNVRPPA